jgi:hypothetical protein
MNENPEAALYSTGSLGRIGYRTHGVYQAKVGNALFRPKVAGGAQDCLYLINLATRSQVVLSIFVCLQACHH